MQVPVATGTTTAKLMPAAVHTAGVSELSVIGIVDGGAVGLVLVAVTKTSGWPRVTPDGAVPKVITWSALLMLNVRTTCGAAL